MRELGVPALRFLALVGAALLASLGIQPDANAACSCQEDHSPLKQQVLSAMQGADYVAIVRIKVVDDMEKTDFYDHSLVAEFEAQRVFKGADSPTFAWTPADENACGVSFKPDETYLIYALQPEELTQVSTSRCMRTALAAESIKDIKILEEATGRKSASRPSDRSSEFARALSLIHSYDGSDDYRWQDPEFVADLSEAMAIADALAKSAPLSGNAQVLRAEQMSIWELRDGGEPPETLQQILKLTDEALRINPAHALAHVARARAYAKSYETMQAVKEIQQALDIDPLLESATLVQAEIYRQDGNAAKAEQWARTFIERAREPARQANGYEWIGRMRRSIAYKQQANNRESNLVLAKAAFENSVELDPKDPWRLINLATFLNEYVADFAGAEKYANQSLELENLEPARYQLAAARYQALQTSAAGMDAQSLQAAIADIGTATGLTLDELAKIGVFHDVVQVRLIRLQRSARPGT
jgi:tetratricopeptide (TPR) repeat protein